MKIFYISIFFIICFCNPFISKSQTGCDFAAIRAAFAAPGHYTELTGVSGQPCSMYFVNTTSQDADLSEQEAQTLGAHMAVFNSAAENSAVTTALYATYSGAIWVGYKRSGIAATTFYAMDGSSGNFTPGAATASLYQNWAGGEPNNSGYQSCGAGCTGSIFLPCVDTYKCTNGEQCTQIYSAGTWNDLPCNTSSISVVEVNLCPVTTINPSATTICGGGSVGLPAGTLLGSAPYTYSWTSSPAGFTSTSASPTATPSVNTTYSVTATDRYGCTSTASVTIYVVPTTVTISGVNAATCTGTCDGSATASASGGTGTGAYAYSWDTAPEQTTATATGLCAGTYVCTVTKGSCVASGPELVVNGNFNSGNTGFSSTYGYVADGAGTTELNPEGKYSIVTGNASQVHGSFTGTGRGGGSFMVINGAGTANVSVWCESITVTPNTDYEFSTWISTMYATSPASLQFSFNGVNQGSINAPSVANGTWIQFFAAWNSGSNTSVNICLINQNTATSGNDFALDDISFKACVPACQDTAMVVITESGITVPPITPATICANGNATLTVIPSGGNGTYTYSWLPAGTGNTASVTVSPSATTTYTVNVTDGNGCAAPPVEVTVTVNNLLNVTVNSASLCFAESATLTASGASTYSWSPATYLSAVTGTSVVCTPTTDITYTVTGSSGGCVGTAVSTVTINPTPDSDAGADITLCSGTTGTIGAPSTPGYVYSWAPATDLSSATDANPTVSPTNYTGSPVAISYIITTSPAGCFSTDTVIVTVNPSLDPTFNYSSSTFCQSGGGADPSPTIVTSGGTFTFTPAGLRMDANTGLIDLALSTLGTYTVTYSHNIACPSSSSTTITITNLPDANFSYSTYCQNDLNPIPAFPPGSSSGVFSAAAGLMFVSPITTPGEVDLSGSTAGTYTVTNTIAAGGGCPAAVATNTITINPIPITTVDDQTVCAGGTAILTASGAATYLWSNGTSAVTLSDNPGTTTSYTVTGTTAGCSSSTTGTITVIPLPVLIVNNATICVGDATTLIASGGSTYSWSPAIGLNTTTGASVIATPTVTTTYTIISSNSANSPGSEMVINGDFSQGNTGFTNDYTHSITFSPGNYYVSSGFFLNAPGGNAPDHTNTNDNMLMGLDGKTAVSVVWEQTINGISNNEDYQFSFWSTRGLVGYPQNFEVHFIGDVTGDEIISNSFSPTIATLDTLIWDNYSLKVWNSLGNNNVIIRIINLQTSANANDFAIDDISFQPVIGNSCSSEVVATVVVVNTPTVTVNDPAICFGNSTNLTAVGANTYLWSDGTTANPKTVSPTSSVSYTVTGTSLGCSASDVADVIITLLPVIKVNSPVICEGQSAVLTASGGSVYDWETGETANFITVSPLTTTTYTVGDNTPGCSGSTTSTVTVNSLPVVTVNAATVCGGQSTTLTASGANTYLWSTGSAINPLTVSPANTASYTVTGTTAAGCTAMASATVSVNSLPVITVNSTSICGGLASTLTASGAISYVWSNGDITVVTIVSPSSTTPYTVTGTDVNGCSGTAIGTVTVFPQPGAQFSTSPDPVGMFNPVVTFNNQSSSDVNYWYWSFGDGDSLDNNTESPTHTYPGDTGSFMATLIVHNAGFCYDTVNHLVLIGPEYSFYIPNAFTPDGDGVNDTFFGKGTGILEYQLMVFDRWGNFIFVTDDIDKGWDGKANGGVNASQQDVYVWKVSLTDIFRKKHHYTGTVSIIRGGE